MSKRLECIKGLILCILTPNVYIRKLTPISFPFPEEAPLLEAGHTCNNNVSDWKYLQILQGIWSEPHFSEYTMQKKRRLKLDFLKIFRVKKAVSCTILHLCSESYISKIIIDSQHFNDKEDSTSDFMKFGNKLWFIGDYVGGHHDGSGVQPAGRGDAQPARVRDQNADVHLLRGGGSHPRQDRPSRGTRRQLRR